MKVISLLLSVILIVSAQAIEYKHDYHHDEHHHEEHGPVEYEFHYSVHDPHTGDIKSQNEKRKDDHVIGSYELIDSDGHKRIVHYKADKHSGFEAVVVREPTDIKIPIPEHHHEYHHESQHHHEQPHHYAKIITHSAPIVHYGHKAELHHGYDH